MKSEMTNEKSELFLRMHNIRGELLGYVEKLEKIIEEKEEAIQKKDVKISDLEKLHKELESKYAKLLLKLDNEKRNSKRLLEELDSIKRNNIKVQKNDLKVVTKKEEINNVKDKYESENENTLNYKENDVSRKSVQVVDEVYVRENREPNCPNCTFSLKSKQVDVAYYGKDTYEINGYMQYKVDYCVRCDYAFVSNNMIKTMINEAKPDEIKYIQLDVKSELEENIESIIEMDVEVAKNDVDNKINLKQKNDNEFIEYLDKLHWGNIGFTELRKIFDKSMKYESNIIMDNLLIKIADHEVTKLLESEFTHIIQKVGEYAHHQVKCGVFSTDGLNYFFNQLYLRNRCKPLLKCIKYIENDIEDVLLNEFDKCNVMVLLKLYFSMSKSDNFIEVIQKITSLKDKNKVVFNENDQIEILYMANIIGVHSKITSNKAFNFVLTYDKPECELYTKYLSELKNNENDYEYSKSILRETKSRCNIDCKIMNKFYPKILRDIIEARRLQRIKTNNIPKRNKVNEQYTKSTDTNVINKKIEDKQENLPVLNSLIRLNNDENCPLDHSYNKRLQKKSIYLAYFARGTNKALTGIRQVNVLYCSGCGKYFVNKSLLDQITKHISLNWIKISNVIGSSKISPYSQDLLDFEKIQSKFNNNISEVGLNKKSKLGELGYSVSLSRNERWRKIEIAISQLGLKEVIKHITWLIRMRKANTSCDNSHALTEWEYDLKRIEKTYMKV